MGGTVSVTVREENGTEHRMERWTNALSYFVTNLKLCQKDPKHLKEYLSTWKDFEDDWKKNGHKFDSDKKNYEVFENQMTPCYCPAVGLAPVDYGLVVIDFKTNNILSMQGYTSLNVVLGSSIRMVMSGYDDPDELDRFKELLYDRRITTYETFGGSGMIKEDLTKTKPCQVLNRFKDMSTIIGMEYLRVDLSPFTLEDFEESAQGALAMKGRLAELGFQYTKKEDKGWLDWITDREE